MFQLSHRFDEIQESATIRMSDRVKRLQASGVSVCDLAGGDPDHATPLHIVDAAKKALDQGLTHYVPSRGMPALLNAISRDVELRNGALYSAERQIIVTPSAKHALYIALLTLVDDGDDVLILSPTWVSHEMIVRLAGARPIFVPIGGIDGPCVTETLLRPYLTPQTKALLVNSPNNPTGRVLTRAELDVIAAFAKAHDLMIVSDEIYSRIVYEGATATSVVAVPDALDRTLLVNGFSKTYAMTGWRIGYLAGPVAVISEALKAQQHTVGCAASFTQIAAASALSGPQDAVTEMVRIYEERRGFIVRGLNEMPGLACAMPAGAFYAWASVHGTHASSSIEFATWLLDVANVAVVPGSAFGAGGEGFIRLSFANNMEVIAEALTRMKGALEARYG